MDEEYKMVIADKALLKKQYRKCMFYSIGNTIWFFAVGLFELVVIVDRVTVMIILNFIWLILAGNWVMYWLKEMQKIENLRKKINEWLRVYNDKEPNSK